MIGRTLAHYRIIAPIGAGGMGEVYRAEDLRLGRQVALKLLPERLAGDPQALARFEREARAVAALSHPNILAIFDLGEDGETRFAVTELLEGRTLRQELDRAGAALPVERALDLAGQAAAGLAASHARGIVHRDLKPENLFLTAGGTLKILDFGLARLAGPAAAADAAAGPDEITATLTDETRPGLVLGTLAYMAPEQLRGESAGPAADLFALGIIAFEMLAGRHPFRRAAPAETMSAILRDEPPSLDSIAPDVPAEVADLVAGCLRKNPSERPPGALEIAERLRALQARGGLGDLRSAGGVGVSAAVHTADGAIGSLAVLPFVNESADPETDYLSDGITDALIDNLCHLPGLRVMARSTVFRYRDGTADPREVGRALGVRAVLTGQLLRRRDQLVIRAELVDARDGRRLWGVRHERPLADLLAIENELGREISANLRLQLEPEHRDRLARGHTGSAEAHEAYLRGRFVWNRWKTPEAIHTAIGFFERALEHDPLYARAHAGLADSYAFLGNMKAVPPEEAYPRAKAAAEQGLAIDPGLAELHTSLGFILRFWDWNWPAAEAAFRKAIALNPSYATAPRWYAQLLSGLGRHAEAIVQAGHALALDPESVILRTSVGDVYFYARRYEEAMEYYRAAIAMDPQSLAGHTDLARALELASRYEEAIGEYRLGAALAAKGPPEPSSGLAHVYARMGRRDEALAIVAELERMRQTRYISPYGIGSIYSCLGDVDRALEWLERAYAEHDQTLVWVKVHPRLDPLRGDPRYQDLLRRMKLE